MKNIFKLLLLSIIILPLSCHDSENIVDGVLDYETGAVLRGIEVYTTEGQSLINSSDDASAFVATIEEQDEMDGALLAEVRMYVDFLDFTPDNGDATSRALGAAWGPADFYEGPHGLPRKDIVFTWGDMKAALGFGPSDATAGDLLKVNFELELTDGRIFGPSSAGPSILGGFFSSPYTYNALLSCDPAPGDYLVKMYDSYGDGWQTTNAGDGSTQTLGLEVYIDGEVRNYAMCSQWNPWEGSEPCTPTADGYYAEQVVNIPDGAAVVTWTWNGDYYAEIGMEVLGVGEYDADGNWTGPMLFSSPGYGSLAPGLLPVSQCAE